MEQHFYLRETKGPGSYMPLEYIYESTTEKPKNFSIPKELHLKISQDFN